MSTPALALAPVLTDPGTGAERTPGPSTPNCSSGPPAATTSNG
jgi:hypothetical protein